MKNHLLLIGFSCTGKTSLGRKAFGGSVVDSDVELREWIEHETGEHFDHIYEVFMRCGRDKALDLIAQAEKALIDEWTGDTDYKIISLGPGFPLHANWPRLRAVSHVILFKRLPEGIYESLRKRRGEIFTTCPEAKDSDNWDIGVIVDAYRNELPREDALMNINGLLAQRDPFYRDNDAEVVTDDREEALEKLQALGLTLGKGCP